MAFLFYDLVLSTSLWKKRHRSNEITVDVISTFSSLDKSLIVLFRAFFFVVSLGGALCLLCICSSVRRGGLRSVVVSSREYGNVFL